MQRKSLIIILCILIFTIISVTIIYLVNIDSINKDLYGTWTIIENKTINNKVEHINNIPWKCIIELQENNKINICYYDDNDKICEEANYKYKNKALTIEENNMYLKGDYNITLKDNTLIMKYIFSDSEQSIITLKRD